MSLYTRLRALITGTPDPDSLDDLRARVVALEAVQIERETEWIKTRDAVNRHLRRIAAVEQRAADQEEPAGDPKARIRQALLLRKFPQQAR